MGYRGGPRPHGKGAGGPPKRYESEEEASEQKEARRRSLLDIYNSFKNGKYDEALKAAMEYRTHQSRSSFRKIYEMTMRALEPIRRGKNIDDNVKNKILLELIKIDITIEYQKNRYVLERDIADSLKDALAEVRSRLEENKVDDARKATEALELALNAVLAYQIAKNK
jgi:CRISPR/Cas system CSM-associated protein Csm2 small subunit